MRPIDVVLLDVAHWSAGALLVFAGALTLRDVGRSPAPSSLRALNDRCR